MIKFEEWWKKQTEDSGQWSSLERLAANSAWEYASQQALYVDERVSDSVEDTAQVASYVPDWIRVEIKETWKTARQCGSQTEAFRLFERMTDRLGYGRLENNPSLAEFSDT